MHPSEPHGKAREQGAQVIPASCRRHNVPDHEEGGERTRVLAVALEAGEAAHLAGGFGANQLHADRELTKGS